MGEAGCAEHPKREAAGRCAECGAPACPTCLLPSGGCRACDARARRRAEDLSTRALFGRAAGLYRRAWPGLLLLASAFALPAAGVDAFARAARLRPVEALQLQGAAGLFVGVVGTVAAARLLVLAGRGQAPAPGEAVLFALRRWPAAVGVFFFAGLVISLGLLLLVVPGLVAGLNLCLALPLLAATRLDANQVLRRAGALVHGERLRLAMPVLLAWGLLGLPSIAAGELPALAATSLPAHLAPGAAALAAWGAQTLVGLLDAAFAAVLVAALQTLASRGDAALQGLGNQLA